MGGMRISPWTGDGGFLGSKKGCNWGHLQARVAWALAEARVAVLARPGKARRAEEASKDMAEGGREGGCVDVYVERGKERKKEGGSPCPVARDPAKCKRLKSYKKLCFAHPVPVVPVSRVSNSQSFVFLGAQRLPKRVFISSSVLQGCLSVCLSVCVFVPVAHTHTLTLHIPPRSACCSRWLFVVFGSLLPCSPAACSTRIDRKIRSRT